MQQFRTTVSVVFWADTPDESEGLVAAVTALLPNDDQASTLATVEYIAAGRPPMATVPESAPATQEVDNDE